MKLKVFDIRLNRENLEMDQNDFNEFMDNVSVKKTCCQLVNAHENYWSILVFYDQKPDKESRTSQSVKISYPTDTILTGEEQKVMDNLKIWRQSKASQLNLPTYMICSNAELLSLVKTKPDSIDKLTYIKGFGDQKIAKLGEEIIAFFNSN
jgi:superfamily II DNA helicase RecQ